MLADACFVGGHNMFREMRRKKQLLSQEETMAILERNTAGTLALAGDDGYPYSVPVSYAYDNNRILIHGAKKGHRVDAVRNCDKASFSVIDKDQIVPEEYTTYFRSAIAFGRISIIEDEEEIRRAADVIGAKYRPGFEKERAETVEKELPAICVMELEIEHLTGKAAREIVE